MTHLTKAELFVLHWLSQEDASLYGECRGEALTRLMELGLAEKVGDPEELLNDYSYVSITEHGFQTLLEVPL